MMSRTFPIHLPWVVATSLPRPQLITLSCYDIMIWHHDTIAWYDIMIRYHEMISYHYMMFPYHDIISTISWQNNFIMTVLYVNSIRVLCMSYHFLYKFIQRWHVSIMFWGLEISNFQFVYGMTANQKYWFLARE